LQVRKHSDIDRSYNLNLATIDDHYQNYTPDNSNSNFINFSPDLKIKNSMRLQPRYSKYRNAVDKINKTDTEQYKPTTRRTKQLYSMRAEPLTNLKAPFSNSRRMVLEKSSGEYGKFAAIDNIDRTLEEIKNRRNHSIAY